MDYGICVASRPADIDDVVEAERLGFSHVWMADSQMIWSDVYAMLALAAERTSTIRLGTGVAVAGTRLAPVTAAAIATINELAPGRAFCGIATRHGDGLITSVPPDPEVVARMRSTLGDLRSGHGHSPERDDFLLARERRHLRIHLGHNCWVIEEEERFVTKSLIERSCLVGTPDELRGRVSELDAAGLDQIVVLPPLEAKERVIADIARELIDIR